MKILAENFELITLSSDKVNFSLMLNEENKYFLKGNMFNPNSFFIRFSYIFGSTHCPNYDIFLQDESFLVQPIALGVLSFFGARPRSVDNSEGMAQSVRLDDNVAKMVCPMLLAASHINILLVSQGHTAPERQVSIGFSGLCCE